jgi:hypothetical protein
MNSRRLRTTSSERAVWIERYERSGLTQRAFADRHRLGLSTLQKWLAQARSSPTSAPTMPWQELKLPTVAGASRWAAELVRPDGLTLRVTPDVPTEWVAALWQLPSC